MNNNLKVYVENLVQSNGFIKDDKYFNCITKVSLIILDNLHHGKSFEEIERLLNSFHLTPFITREVYSIIVNFSPRGYEFINYMAEKVASEIELNNFSHTK